MRGTRGEAPHPGRVTGVSMFISTFVSMFLFLVVVSECRHQWLRYARLVWQVVGGECRPQAWGTRIVRTLVAHACLRCGNHGAVARRLRCLPVASMPLPTMPLLLPTVTYYALALVLFRRSCLWRLSCLWAGPHGPHGPHQYFQGFPRSTPAAHMVHTGERHRRQDSSMGGRDTDTRGGEQHGNQRPTQSARHDTTRSR